MKVNAAGKAVLLSLPTMASLQCAQEANVLKRLILNFKWRPLSLSDITRLIFHIKDK